MLKHLEIVYNSGCFLEFLVRNMLDLFSILQKNFKLNIKMFNVRNACDEIVKMFLFSAEKKGLSITIDSSADAQMILSKNFYSGDK